jgi:hypothetical protein
MDFFWRRDFSLEAWQWHDKTGTLCNILTFGTFVGLTAGRRTSKETRVRLGGRFVCYFFGLRLLMDGSGVEPVEPVLSVARQPLIYPYFTHGAQYFYRVCAAWPRRGSAVKGPGPTLLAAFTAQKKNGFGGRREH